MGSCRTALYGGLSSHVGSYVSVREIAINAHTLRVDDFLCQRNVNVVFSEEIHEHPHSRWRPMPFILMLAILSMCMLYLMRVASTFVFVFSALLGCGFARVLLICSYQS
jgi:hypothetical protein